MSHVVQKQYVTISLMYFYEHLALDAIPHLCLGLNYIDFVNNR